MRRGPLLGTALAVLLCAALALAGTVVALRAAKPMVRSFSLGAVAVSVSPAWDGRLDAYVPIVDWGVRARPYRVPLAVEVQFRSLDREAALAAVRSGSTAGASLERARHELEAIVNEALWRAAGTSLAGGLVGGFLAGGLVVAFGRRRRWLAGGTAAGLTCSLVALGIVAAGVGRADYGSLRQPTFYAHGGEMAELLAFSEELMAAAERYSRSYDRAVAGLTELIHAAGNGEPARPVTRSAVVASDLHSNSLVLPALEEYTAGRPVFLPGDFSQLGTRYEHGIVPALGRLGSPAVAVSGNHDSRPFMVAAARAGVVVLTRTGRLLSDGSTDGEPIFELDGLEVAGFDDPLEGSDGAVRHEALDLKEGSVFAARRELVDWFYALPRRPDVVLVHQHALAHGLLDALAAEDGPPVIVLTGHDHHQHVERAGRHVLVDGGTVGAGGPFGIGDDAAGFAQIHLDADDRLRAVDLIEIEALSGTATARRQVIDYPDQPSAP